MLNSAGQVVWAATLAAWGSVDERDALSAEYDCPIRFQGQWFDQESGLHYNRYRYYDPSTARFISSDPIELDAGYWEGSGANLYAYAINPTTWLDPLGLAKKSCGDKPRKPRSQRPIGKRVMFGSRKAAREAAEHASPIGQAVAHPSHGHGPHYHPLDRRGNPTHDHYYFPKKDW
jgi:RHS repeat-associated protein